MFKKGDRVRVIAPYSSNRGREGEISRTDGSLWPFKVRFDGMKTDFHYHARELELVSQPEPSLDVSVSITRTFTVLGQTLTEAQADELVVNLNHALWD